MAVDTQNYAFIDGNYLRRAYEDTMRKYFPDADAANLDLSAVKQTFRATKVFYYDSVDETAPNASKRLEALEHIRSLDGFHVRQGTITGERKRQKQVDVQLAVDALLHAFNKNMWHASLVAGDLDFKPLVDALVNLGIHVHVWYESKSAARGLYHAADVAAAISLTQFWQWSTHAFRKDRPIPNSIVNDSSPAGIVEQQGTWRGRPIELHKLGGSDGYALYAPAQGDVQSLKVHFTNRDELLKFFDLERGPVAWNAS